MRILGIETSCDECSSSVVEISAGDALSVRSLVTHSQIEIHQPFGGVVPEVASRNHLETINGVIEASLTEAGIRSRDVDAVAVTNRPGLVGALLVGVSAAKALAYAAGKPLVAVHHLEGHAASVFLDRAGGPDTLEYPLLLAVVSGGHTNLHLVERPPADWGETFLRDSLIGRSLDDAAGEAFDKTAKLMGFPYPGGVHVDRGSKGGNPAAFRFPRALPQKSTLDFSFSGLKTAVALEVERLVARDELDARIADLCASVQEAIVGALFGKMELAIERHGCRSLVIVGGVAANSRLRALLEERCPVPAHFPLPRYCTDNAAMIAAAGAYRFRQKRFLSGDALLTLNAVAAADC